MATGSNSGMVGNQDGFQFPRRSKRGRKPKATDNFVPSVVIPRRTKASLRGRQEPSGNAPRPSGATGRQRQQVQSNRRSPRHHVSSESDDDDYYSDGCDSTDTIENLEDQVEVLTSTTKESLTEMEFIIKLIFHALPRESIMKLRTYALTSNQRSTIEHYLEDIVGVDSANTLNREGSVGSTNANGQASEAVTRPRPGAGPREEAGTRAAAATTAAASAADAVAMGTDDASARERSGRERSTQEQQQQPSADVPQQQRRQQADVRGRNGGNSADLTNNLREQEEMMRRRKNIVVKGLREDLDDGDQGGVHRMLDVLGLGYLKGRDLHARRVGRSSDDKPRILIVTFENEQDVEEILRDKLKLFSTYNSPHGNFRDVFIDPDLSREERQRQFRERRVNRFFNDSDRRDGDGSIHPPPGNGNGNSLRRSMSLDGN